MSLIFEHSCLAAKPELDIFSTPPTMAALEDSWSTEYLPTTSLDDTSPIKFMISGDSNHYIDPYSSYLYLEVKITKQDGTDIDAGTQIGPVNLLAHSLFQQVDVWLNDTLITSSSNLYHYRAYLETLLSFSDESKKSQLTMSLYSKDTPGQMDDIADANTGLVARREFTDESKTVPLICKLHSDIFLQKRLLLNGVDMRIKLIRNSDKFVLMGANNSTHKLKITAASFFVRKVKVNNGIQLQHIELMDKKMQPAIYPIRKVDMKTYNVSTGSLSMNEESLFSGILPKRIVIGFVTSKAFEGGYDKNPFNFTHQNLCYCTLLIDGKMVPQKPLVSNFTNGETLRNYFMLLQSTGHIFNNGGVDFDRSDFNQGYTLLAFDLTPDQDESGCYHVLKKGSIRLELKFASALTEPVNIIVFAESDAAIKIDKNRQVLTNFSR
ncbi:uncharacterized protein F54H12.2-like [Watersipora subatra]|uniref:uncharacterized protein F54H12.2-like n=1 Tax=Watersipora subatra TaxID=2589382 RepID=UPI00355BA3F3